MNYLGYTFSLLSGLIYCIGRFKKEKKNILLFDLMSKLLMSVSLFLFGSLTGSINFIINFIFLLVFNLLIRKKKFNMKDSVITFTVFFIAYIVSCILTYNGYVSALVCLASSLSLFANSFLREQKMRLMSAFTSVFYLTYYISIGNYAGALEIVPLLSNVISYMKYKKAK